MLKHVLPFPLAGIVAQLSGDFSLGRYEERGQLSEVLQICSAEVFMGAISGQRNTSTLWKCFCVLVGFTVDFTV